MATDSVENGNSLQCIINVFLIIRQNARVIWAVKREIQSFSSLLKHVLIPYIAICIQCRLDTLINLPFISTLLIYKFIRLMFATSTFDLNIMFSSMLSIIELCQCKQGSCLVYTLVISKCYISCIVQNLNFIFRVPIRNTIIKYGHD
jgi:hypothetical protein